MPWRVKLLVPEHAEPEPLVEELAKDIVEKGLDPTTRRESFELDLQEQGRSKDGEKVDLNEIEDK